MDVSDVNRDTSVNLERICVNPPMKAIKKKKEKKWSSAKCIKGKSNDENSENHDNRIKI